MHSRVKATVLAVKANIYDVYKKYTLQFRLAWIKSILIYMLKWLLESTLNKDDKEDTCL